jgi:exodeoxyribonuclease VII small subunit
VNPTAKTGSDGPASFETQLEELEKIIERIEAGEIGLEASIAEYERGVGLIRRCREVLTKAEQRVEELNKELLRTENGRGDQGGG